MEITKDKLLETLDDIRKLIIDSEKPDGSLKIDMKMSMVALEFAKTEIKKSISKWKIRIINTRRWNYAFTHN